MSEHVCVMRDEEVPGCARGDRHLADSVVTSISDIDIA